MSFKSALRGTQINQRYRQNAAELQNIDRGMIDSQNAYARQDNLKNNALQALGSTSLLAGSLGKNLTEWGQNIGFAGEQGLQSGGLMNMLNPFKKGGFGQTYSKNDGPNMTIEDLGKTKNLMDWSNAYMPKNPLEFGDASSISMADNPMISLMSLYNQRFNTPKKIEDESSDYKRLDYKPSDYNTQAGAAQYKGNQNLPIGIRRIHNG